MTVLSTAQFTYYTPDKKYVAELSDFGRMYIGNSFMLKSADGTWEEQVVFQTNCYDKEGELVSKLYKFSNPMLAGFKVEFFND